MAEPTLPPTNLLYMTYDGNWMAECDAKVLRVRKNADDEHVQIYLDQTVLHAQGGGQPTDTGVIVGSNGEELHVNKVMVDREAGTAVHHVNLTDGNCLLDRGDFVRVKVNEERRRILSECHTAGHVVDSAMARCGKVLKPSKAYHFLDGPYVEYEGAVPPAERNELLTSLQEAFCQLIQEDIPTTIDLLSKRQADEVCNRQAQNFDVDLFADKRTEQIRVVTVAGYPCPCGGKSSVYACDVSKNV
jgi:Ser-tRNA(Ala) deacylase AlaX